MSLLPFLSLSFLIWVLLIEINPIRFLLQFTFITLNLSYILSFTPLSFFSFLIIIIYGSALSILFGIIVMVYKSNHNKGSIPQLGFISPKYTNTENINYLRIWIIFMIYCIIKLFIYLQLETTFDYIIVQPLTTTILPLLYNHLYNLSLIYNVWNILIIVIILLVTMLFLVISLI